ncbi:MAG: hypothetical protein WCT51_01145 [Candidatus Shapirobacteria bacterium]|jgi:hypothetical protein
MNETLKTKLVELGLNDDQISKLESEGAKTEANMIGLSPEEIRTMCGCGFILAKEIAKAFIPTPPEKGSESIAVLSAGQPSMDVLPQVPDDVSFLNMLKVGGELKVGETEVIAAIRASLADKSGLYELPKILANLMEKFAEEQEVPCSNDFYSLQKLLIRRNYAEIFSALEIDSASVTQPKKDALLKKLRINLWPALLGFHQQIIGWFSTYQQTAANPAAMMGMFSMLASGNGSAASSLIQAPDTNTLRDAAESVIDQINRVFAGTGIVISRALALDANNIKTVLENPSLPGQIGASNHDQMIKMLSVNVSADYVRLERNITRYALAIMEFPKVTAGQSELSYLTAMFQLGNAIPWDKLDSKEVVAGTGSTFRTQ